MKDFPLPVWPYLHGGRINSSLPIRDARLDSREDRAVEPMHHLFHEWRDFRSVQFRSSGGIVQELIYPTVSPSLERSPFAAVLTEGIGVLLLSTRLAASLLHVRVAVRQSKRAGSDLVCIGCERGGAWFDPVCLSLGSCTGICCPRHRSGLT